MKVVILGAYGVFGSRLVELLVRDGHEVIASGRDAHKLVTLTKRLGCQQQLLDHCSEPQAIFTGSPDVVVDAAGPYQAYGDDPYIIPRLCAQRGIDYLDLSDDPDFTQGITQLDEMAHTNSCRLLSGASSVPGVSSTIAADLAAGLDEILLIDTAILPGNRAPRGASVIASIISQLGTSSRVFRAGQWREQACWSDPASIQLAPNLTRSARFIEVPDIRLFPAFFNARSVMFRAGLELNLLNRAMLLIALIRRHWRFAVTPRRAELLRRLANLFLSFGTDRGGMRVAIVGRKGTTTVQREWHLVAEAGDGPYIPAVTARALIRKLAQLPMGARPCLAETTRMEIEAAMSDLKVTTTCESSLHTSLMQAALADKWQQLLPAAQRLHCVYDEEVFSGVAQITRGKNLLARFAAWLLRFPPAGDQVQLTVTKTRTSKGEIWKRDFAGSVFYSVLTPSPILHRYRERFGPVNYELKLVIENGNMHLPVQRGWLLGIPLPLFLLPLSESREFVQDGIFHFDVALSGPLGIGLIVRYRGQLQATN